jgi:thioredoxin reductase
VLCTDGASGLKPEESSALALRGIHLLPAKIARLEGTESGVDRIIFADGSDLPVAAVFMGATQVRQSDLAARLGCRAGARGVIQKGKSGETSVPGVYVAGDASGDTQLAIIAAAEGATSAIAINRALTHESEG